MSSASQPVSALGAAVPIPATADPDRYEVTLPSGAKASIMRRAKGKHVVLAHRMTNNEGGLMFTLALVAVKAIVDGRALTVEDVIERLDDLDVLELMKLVQSPEPGKPGKGPSSPPGT